MSRALCGAALLLVLAATLVLTGPAAAVDVSQLSDFEADPCVIALAQRNTAQHIGAPDSALANACERAHGGVEAGWDIVLRTWKAPDARQAFTPAGGQTATAAGLGLLGMLLVYAAMGWPARPIVTLLRPPGAMRPVRPRRLAAKAGAVLLTRLILGTALLLILAIPFAPVIAALLLAWRLIAAIGWRPRRAAPAAMGEPPSALAEVVAGAINDGAANIGGLLGLALFARGGWRLLAFGVLLAILFSLPVVVQAWRAMRAVAAARIALGTLAAAAVGIVAVRDPAMATLVASAPALAFIVPLAFGLVVTWRGGAVERLLPRQGPPQIPGT